MNTDEKRGASPNGFLNALKPPSMTAHDVVAVLRRKLNTRKIGHAGTLDPAAAGVLPVAVGNATRLLRFLRHDKEYLAEILFGIKTNTLDSEGTILHKEPMSLTEQDLSDLLPRFTGRIEQRVPAVSAVQIDGKRLYSLARQGIEIERPIRTVEFHELELLHFIPGDFPRALLRVHCSGGTYIRSLAEDLGEALGGTACLSFLLRTMACGFRIEQSHTFEEIDLETLLLAPEQCLSHLPSLELDSAASQRFLNGQVLENPNLQGDVRIMGEGRLLGIARAEEQQLRAEVVLK